MTLSYLPPTVELTLTFQEFPPVVTRGSQVLWCLTTPANEFVLSRKNAYPAKIYRFVGGGVEHNERVEVAALRELTEETGLEIESSRMHKICTVKALIRDQHHQHILFESHIFHLVLSPTEVRNIRANDDIDEIKTFTLQEIQQVIAEFKNQPSTIDPTKGFSWYDYGQLFGPVHQVALDYVNKAGVEGT